MCRVYNAIGSLVTIQCHLVNNDLDEFHSLNELINFQRDYHANQQKIILDHTRLIKQEQKDLEKDITYLNDLFLVRKNELRQELKQRLDKLNQEIQDLPVVGSKVIPVLVDYYKNLAIWTKIWSAQLTFRFKSFVLERRSNQSLSKKNNRNQYIRSNFEEAVSQSGASELVTHKKKKTVVEEINKSIYGAIGEHRVEELLKNLSDDYVLINDFCCSFNPPIYNRQGNDYIKSIQIDHILIGPSGIFSIETKNWSDHSLSNIDLRSPVQQVIRANYALYRMLAGQVRMSRINLKKHHWGDRKIPVKNLIVFINKKPRAEFQYVKILTLTELFSYVRYFPPIFTYEETQMIADFLLEVSHQKRPLSKLTI